jgi:uncharacterized FlaG/YvyC family protein
VDLAAARPEPVPQKGAVATELPADKSVGSAWDSAAVRHDVSTTAAGLSHAAERTTRPAEQRFERDRKTNQLVFKLVDLETGEALMQLPDQSLLDLRAYLRQAEAFKVVSRTA